MPAPVEVIHIPLSVDGRLKEVMNLISGCQDTSIHRGGDISSQVDSGDPILELQLRAMREAHAMDKEIEVVPGEERHCKDCGDPIAERRLRALPTACRCKECQEIFEMT